MKENLLTLIGNHVQIHNIANRMIAQGFLVYGGDKGFFLVDKHTVFTVDYCNVANTSVYTFPVQGTITTVIKITLRNYELKEAKIV